MPAVKIVGGPADGKTVWTDAPWIEVAIPSEISYWEDNADPIAPVTITKARLRVEPVRDTMGNIVHYAFWDNREE